MIVISSGHGKYVRGASGYLDEVTEARRVVNQVAVILRSSKVDCATFHDDTSHDQNTNLHTIVAAHNSHPAAGRLDVSVHFNAYQTTTKPMGTECLYLTAFEMATAVTIAVSDAGDFIDRGAKKNTGLYFLNQTTGDQGAVLVEICFVDSSADAALYQHLFNDICSALAAALSGKAPF